MEILSYSDTKEHRIIYKWNIKKATSFIECSKNDPDSVILNSTEFKTTAKIENSWYLRLRIKNDKLSRRKEWISLYLCRKNGEKNIKISYSLFILDNENKEKFKKTYYNTRTKSSERGCSWFLDIKGLLQNEDRFLPNDTLTIGVELTVYEDYQSFPTEFLLETPQRKITDDLKELYDSKSNSDVILVVGNEKFNAHKLILSTRSPVFSAMFTHEMKEKRDSEVTIPDIDPEIFNKLLEFIYTDKITNLDADAAYLLEAADKYQLLNLKSLCEESLSKSVRIDNAIELMVLADMHNANQFLEFIFKFIIKNSKDVIKTLEYGQLEKTRPLLLLKLIQKLADLNEN
ncbi:speckle-type POZ protein B-like [Microplitis mediator]|uniref:speckle-type POZ protein B-like n=1 Tax=Microplitis mediator TaxID=375433 RepID=UPI002552A998|nr:speckle-type POZ protein B-like [Microplitis mediator]